MKTQLHTKSALYESIIFKSPMLSSIKWNYMLLGMCFTLPYYANHFIHWRLINITTSITLKMHLN